MTQSPNFLETVQARGFIHQCSNLDGLAAHMNNGPVTAYIGFDATADSLHVGHLMSIMTLRWFQKCGHKPVVLVGGGTTRIGDPSFRDSSRPMLSEAEINANIEGIKKVFGKFLTFGEGSTDAVLVNNADWLNELSYIDLLQNVGRHFSVNRMLSFDSVKLRLEREQPLTFLEFNYMILQGFDFVELSKRLNCTLQMGGSDQWGNIVNGLELGRRMDGKELFGLTTNLLTTSSGAKMGKTASGAVWLNEERLSPWEFWQFWRNTEDADVGRFLRLFTELPLPEISRVECLHGQEINEAKKILADEVTALCHGREIAQKMRQTAEATFEQGALGDDLPQVQLSEADLTHGVPVIDLMIRLTFASTKSQARRLIRGGGVKIKGHTIEDELMMLGHQEFGDESSLKISLGRKRQAVIKV